MCVCVSVRACVCACVLGRMRRGYRESAGAPIAFEGECLHGIQDKLTLVPQKENDILPVCRQGEEVRAACGAIIDALIFVNGCTRLHTQGSLRLQESSETHSRAYTQEGLYAQMYTHMCAIHTRVNLHALHINTQQGNSNNQGKMRPIGQRHSLPNTNKGEQLRVSVRSCVCMEECSCMRVCRNECMDACMCVRMYVYMNASACRVYVRVCVYERVSVCV